MPVNLDTQSLFDVKGLVAVVTGGGSGIGLMMAQALEANGAIVYIIGRRMETLEKAAATAKHKNIHPILGDVTSKPSLSAAADAISASTGGYIDLLIANAGISGPTPSGLPINADLATFHAHLDSWDTDAFNQTFATNVTGVFNTILAFLFLLEAGNQRHYGGSSSPRRRKQRSQIIATSSIGGFSRVPLSGVAYSTSKTAVVHMMKQFASTLAPYGIRSNVIAPGYFPSELTVDIIETGDSLGWPKTMVPEQRAGDIEDMAGAVLFLASRAGAYINGNVLVTDGGRLGIVPAAY
ncbi:NAD(P)-binding protein [Xylaria sp. CBS 124048]|nr:NAD(P)-binding protein [Xylaria sp. CBS 124048]